MAEESISAAVGAPHSPNKPDDVKIIQRLLGKVTPPLAHVVAVTGTMDSKTLAAIREFQLRFTSSPDSRVDPDGRTLWHLNDGFVSTYIHCSSAQKRMLDHDIVDAQRWLGVAIRRLGSMDSDAKRVMKNVFHIDTDDSAQSSRLSSLRSAYVRLRVSMDQSFPLECEPKVSVFGAWVDINDPTGTMHFPSNHFAAPAADRTERIIHERSHTVFRISHDGMVGAGEVDFGRSADDDNGFTYQQAINNAYCYGWLATALQPDYLPSGGDVIVVGKPR
jgi:hypothetical protein